MWKNKLTIAIKNSADISVKIILLVIVACFGLLLFYDHTVLSYRRNQVGYSSPKGAGVKITFSGDVSPTRYLEAVSAKYGPEIFYGDSQRIWADSDLTLVNLEAALLKNDPQDGGYRQQKKDIPIHFNARPEDAQALIASGVNLVSLANNHSLDYEAEGLAKGIDILQSLGLDYVGAGKTLAEASAARTIRAGAKKIGILAITERFTPGSLAKTNVPGVLTTAYPYLDHLIEKFVRDHDFTVVYIHWGTEYSLKPDQKTRALGRQFIDWGVDLVIGSHPHVLLPVESYNEGLIVYSLGNLVFDQKRGRVTDSAVANLYIERDKIFLEFVPIKLVNGVPFITANPIITGRIFRELTKELPRERYRTARGTLIVEFRAGGLAVNE